MAVSNTAAKKTMEAALFYLGYGDKTEKEMRGYLSKKGFEKTGIDAALERLTELGLIDDKRYAEHFVECRTGGCKDSKKKIREQLLKHGIDKQWIDSAFENMDSSYELNCANALVAKLLPQLASLPPRERKEKLMRRLYAKGFDYNIIKSALGPDDLNGFEEE